LKAALLLAPAQELLQSKVVGNGELYAGLAHEPSPIGRKILCLEVCDRNPKTSSKSDLLWPRTCRRIARLEKLMSDKIKNPTDAGFWLPITHIIISSAGAVGYRQPLHLGAREPQQQRLHLRRELSANL
jgi:hypothetical protein